MRCLPRGESHKPGEDTDTERHYRNLEEWARERFGVTDFRNRWSTQDYSSVDGLPFVGRAGKEAEREAARRYLAGEVLREQEESS